MNDLQDFLTYQLELLEELSEIDQSAKRVVELLVVELIDRLDDNNSPLVIKEILDILNGYTIKLKAHEQSRYWCYKKIGESIKSELET